MFSFQYFHFLSGVLNRSFLIKFRVPFFFNLSIFFKFNSNLFTVCCNTVIPKIINRSLGHISVDWKFDTCIWYRYVKYQRLQFSSDQKKDRNDSKSQAKKIGYFFNSFQNISVCIWVSALSSLEHFNFCNKSAQSSCKVFKVWFKLFKTKKEGNSNSVENGGKPRKNLNQN